MSALLMLFRRQSDSAPNSVLAPVVAGSMYELIHPDTVVSMVAMRSNNYGLSQAMLRGSFTK